MSCLDTSSTGAYFHLNASQASQAIAWRAGSREWRTADARQRAIRRRAARARGERVRRRRDPREYEGVTKVSARGEDPDEIAEEPAANGAAGRGPALGPAGAAPARRCSALWALARAAGTVLLILVVASVVALILNPLVRMLERITVPRGLAIVDGVSRMASRCSSASAWLLAEPGHRPRSATSSTTCRSLVRQANRDLANLQTFLDDHGHQRPHPAAGPDRAADPPEGRRSSARATSSRSRATCSSRSSRSASTWS